jgi:HEAT repeat protein
LVYGGIGDDKKGCEMTTSNKRIVAYHISRLQDKNRDVRLKSIAELALIADEDALGALRTLVEKDSDSEVRKAAQEAGRAIFVKLHDQIAGNKG